MPYDSVPEHIWTHNAPTNDTVPSALPKCTSELTQLLWKDLLSVWIIMKMLCKILVFIQTSDHSNFIFQVFVQQTSILEAISVTVIWQVPGSSLIVAFNFNVERISLVKYL